MSDRHADEVLRLRACEQQARAMMAAASSATTESRILEFGRRVAAARRRDQRTAGRFVIPAVPESPMTG